MQSAVCSLKFFKTKFADHSYGVPAIIIFIPVGIPQLSDPSRQYSRNNHTDTRRKPGDSAGFLPFPSPCTPLVLRPLGGVTHNKKGELVPLLSHPRRSVCYC